MDEPPSLLMVAGPNGSGKTTLTKQLRADGVEFGEYINADDLALDLPGDYDARVRAAQRAADEARENCIARKVSFTFETVMSHVSKLEVLERAKLAGFRTAIYFVATDSPDLNVARVRQRVALGGHDVEEARIRDRYRRTLEFLPRAIEIVDLAVLFDNTRGIGPNTAAVLRPFFQRAGGSVTVEPPIPRWAQPAVKQWITL